MPVHLRRAHVAMRNPRNTVAYYVVATRATLRNYLLPVLIKGAENFRSNPQRHAARAGGGGGINERSET